VACASERRSWALAVLAAALAPGLACTDPQSGIFQSAWCRVTGAEAELTVVLDDMEDGDGKPCGGQGSWSLAKDPNSGETTPAEGTIAKTEDLPPDDLVLRGASVRALHVSGRNFADGGWAILRLDIPAAHRDLTPYKEVQFWARADSPGALTIRAAVVTAVTAGGSAHWGSSITLTDKWGDNGDNPISFPLIGEGDGVVSDGDKDLGQSLALEIQFTASPAVAAFGFWIDDIVLKRLPPSEP
jgi:hypothetical protein